MRNISMLLAGLFASGSALAWETPQLALSEFLKFELSGGRTSAWPLTEYLAVEKGYDEPGWDMVSLIRRHQVLALRCSGERCTAKVQFEFQPTKRLKSEQLLPHPEGGREVVEYPLVRVNGEWLLADTKGTPRVSYTAYIRRSPNRPVQP